MRNFQWFPLTVGLLLAILVSACAGAPTAAPTEAPKPVVAPTVTSEPLIEPTVDFENQLEDFNPNNFDDSTNIDNQWFPLKPGMQYVYEGVTEEGGDVIPHRVVFTVTDLTKLIDGVRTVVVWDRDYSSGTLEENEIVFFAQDIDGNVWHLGQYPEVYERGELIETPAWITGIKDARAGIVMKAQPSLGKPSYSQGWGPAVSWTDRAQVAQVGQQTCVHFDCYEDVTVIEEFSQEEPGAFQLKYYAPGVGNVRVGWRGLDATRETLELAEIIQLDPDALAEARAQALEMEARAYEMSKEVYGQTSPLVSP